MGDSPDTSLPLPEPSSATGLLQEGGVGPRKVGGASVQLGQNLLRHKPLCWVCT